MADTAMVHEGCAPWKPTPESKIVAQYRYYDIPLVGVIEQDDRRFMFYCVDGVDEILSLWWYAEINSEQRKLLDEAHENFDEVLRTMDFGGWGRVALATTNVGIVDSENFDMDDHDGPEGFGVAVGKLRERLHRLSELADEIEPVLVLS